MAVDRFQTICYPMVHRIWKPSRSHRKTALAWALALAFCAPQALVFGVGEDGRCGAVLGTLQGQCCNEMGDRQNGGHLALGQAKWLIGGWRRKRKQ